jgi:hypothetical protein
MFMSRKSRLIFSALMILATPAAYGQERVVDCQENPSSSVCQRSRITLGGGLAGAVAWDDVSKAHVTGAIGSKAGVSIVRARGGASLLVDGSGAIGTMLDTAPNTATGGTEIKGRLGAGVGTARFSRGKGSAGIYVMPVVEYQRTRNSAVDSKSASGGLEFGLGGHDGEAESLWLAGLYFQGGKGTARGEASSGMTQDGARLLLDTRRIRATGQIDLKSFSSEGDPQILSHSIELGLPLRNGSREIFARYSRDKVKALAEGAIVPAPASRSTVQVGYRAQIAF